MRKSGIKIVSDTPGTGPELKKGDRVRLRYDIQLNRGDFLVKDQEEVLTVGDRNSVAGFRYGLEGMRAGGARKFRAGPHLCYRDQELASIREERGAHFRHQECGNLGMTNRMQRTPRSRFCSRPSVSDAESLIRDDRSLGAE